MSPSAFEGSSLDPAASCREGGASLELLLGEWEPIPEVTDAEREVADLLPIDASPDEARAALERVPLWFHTFLLSRQAGIYAPGIARDHRYRIPALPESFEGLRVLDVGTFDGF